MTAPPSKPPFQFGLASLFGFAFAVAFVGWMMRESYGLWLFGGAKPAIEWLCIMAGAILVACGVAPLLIRVLDALINR